MIARPGKRGPRECLFTGLLRSGKMLAGLLQWFLIGFVFSQNTPDAGVFMLSGGTVHTISGPVIENGSVLVRDGRIIGVGRGLHAPEGATVIDIHGQHVYPGMIDSAGMPGMEKSDGHELGLLNPQLRVEAGVNPDSDEIALARANGVTSVMVLPQGELLAGQLSLIHMGGDSKPGGGSAVHLRFPAIVTTPIPPHESFEDDEDPGTAVPAEPVEWAVAKKDYDEKLRALNHFFDEARRYRHARPATKDARYEALLPVIEGTTPLFVTALREREIREAIAFSVKQKIRIILADAYECYKVIPLIKAHNIAVVLGPPLSLPLTDDDPYDRSYTTAAELSKAGIRFSIGTFSYRQGRNLPYQAAAAVAFGLAHDEAYKAISLNAAEIFGLGKRFGSIDEGKVADLIVTDGDPLETTTKVTQVFIDGKPVSLETRQKKLADKYSARP